MKKIMDKIINVGAFLGAVLIVWFFASFCDINAHNHEDNPQYWSLNVFVLMCGKEAN